MIRFQDADREVTFEGEYKPTTGPLPTLRYPLVGLWREPDGDKRVIKALFKASKVPVHGNEPILHRYEGVSHQGHAKYRYFTVAGHAGMVLSPQQLGRDLVGIAQHLMASANDETMKPWVEGAREGLYELVSVPDQLGNFAPIILCRKAASLTCETPA